MFQRCVGNNLKESKPFPTLPPRHQCFLASFHQGFQATLPCKGGTTTVTTDGANLSSESLRDIRKCRYNPWLFVVWNEAKSTSQKKSKGHKRTISYTWWRSIRKKKAVGKNCGWKGNDLTGDNVTSQDATLKKMKINFHLKTAAPGEVRLLLAPSPVMCLWQPPELSVANHCRRVHKQITMVFLKNSQNFPIKS